MKTYFTLLLCLVPFLSKATLVIAVKKGNEIYVGCDSKVTTVYRDGNTVKANYTYDAEKFFYGDSICIGISGVDGVVMGDEAKRFVKWHNADSLTSFLVTTFIATLNEMVTYRRTNSLEIYQKVIMNKGFSSWLIVDRNKMKITQIEFIASETNDAVEVQALVYSGLSNTSIGGEESNRNTVSNYDTWCGVKNFPKKIKEILKASECELIGPPYKLYRISQAKVDVSVYD